MSQEEVKLNDDLRRAIKENEPFLNNGQRSLISFVASKLSVLEINASYLLTPSVTTNTEPSTEAASGSVDSNTGITNEHKEEMSNLWTYMQTFEEFTEQLKAELKNSGVVTRNLQHQLDGLRNELEKLTEEARQRSDSTVKTDQEVKDEDNEANRQLKAELLEVLDSTVTEQVNSMFKELLDMMADSESSRTTAIKKLECQVDKLKKLDERLPRMYERLSALEKANEDKSELHKLQERLSALEKAKKDKSELHKLQERLSALEKANNDKSELKEIYEHLSALEKANNDKSELKEIYEHLSALEKANIDKSELKEIYECLSALDKENNDKLELKEIYERLSALEKENNDKSELKEIYERLSALEKANNDKSDLQEIFEHLSALDMATNDMSELNKLKERLSALENSTVDGLKEKASEDRVMSLENMGREKMFMHGEDIEQLKAKTELSEQKMSQEKAVTSEAVLESADSNNKALQELRQQTSSLRNSVQLLEKDIEQLKIKQILSEERMLQDRETTSEAASGSADFNTGITGEHKEEMSNLWTYMQSLKERTEQLKAKLKNSEDMTKNLQHQLDGLQNKLEKKTEEARHRSDSTVKIDQEVKGEDNVQEANRQLKVELQEGLELTVTERLNSMFNELLDKMDDSESRQHEAIKKLSGEMECKVDKIEFDSLKKKLKDEWEKTYQRLQAQEAPEITDAAGLKTELKTRFHHLSCDQPVAKNTPGPQPVNLPYMPGFPCRRYTEHMRAFELWRLRQHSNNPTGGSKQVANTPTPVNSKTAKLKGGSTLPSKTNTKEDHGSNPASAEESLLMVRGHSIKRPKEGTIITVIREWAEYINEHKHIHNDFETLLIKAEQVAREALSRTTEQLEALKIAKVVDAGAKGFVLFLEGMIETIKKRAFSREDHDMEHLLMTDYELPMAEAESLTEESLHNRYCTETCIIGNDIPRQEVLDILEEDSDSIVIAGSDSKLRLHFHTNHPADMFSKLKKFGDFTFQKVDDMRLQYNVTHHRKSPIAFVVDSGTSLPKEFMDEHQIHYVPVTINVNGTSYLDGRTITSPVFSTVFDDKNNKCSTSQPNPKSFADTFGYLSNYYESIIVLTLGSKISGTYNSALQGKELIQRKKDVKIDIVDSVNLSAGIDILAYNIAKDIESGFSHDDILSRISTNIKNITNRVNFNTIDHLIKSGRLGKFKGGIIKALGLSPIIQVLDGKPVIAGKSIGFKKSLDKTIKMISKEIKETAAKQNKKVKEYMVSHSYTSDEAKEYFVKKLEGIFGKPPVDVNLANACYISSIGKSAISVAVLYEN